MKPNEDALEKGQDAFAICTEIYESCKNHLDSIWERPPSKSRRKSKVVSGASGRLAVRKSRLIKSASIALESPATSSMAVIATSTKQRLTRLLGKGALILAVQPGQPEIDITRDIVRLLELSRDMLAALKTV